MMTASTSITEDRNKTPLTHDVTEATRLWLDGHGFKPIETEVPICQGWCADLAAVITPTNTELIELKLMRRRPSWRLCGTPQHDEWEKLADSRRRVMTCLVEVKTSRGDFRGDKKWKLTPPVDLSYLAVPAGLITPDEYPESWGILELGTDGFMKQVRVPDVRTATTEQQLSVILEIAIRRDHHTRYERFRQIQKQQRIEQAKKRGRSDMRKIALAVRDVVNARFETVELCLAWHQLEDADWFAEQCSPLYGKGKTAQ